MADVRYPNGNVNALARPDIAQVRFVEFDVNFAKVTAATGDNIILGSFPRGTAVFGGFVEQVTPAASATGSVVLDIAGAISGSLAGNAAAKTIANNVLDSVTVMTADTNVNLVLTGTRPDGKARVVVFVSEAIKPDAPTLVIRDAIAG